VEGADGQLVGRGETLDGIASALRDRAGTHVIAIEGVPGIGKTSLLEAAAAASERAGARVLRARSSELERELPFGVMRQLLGPAVRAAPDGERAALLGGAAAFAAAALAAQPAAANDGFAVLDGLYWLVANLAAATPLVLAVDDLQWADAPSLRALAYLAARLDGVDAQLCVALRRHEPGSDEPLIEAVVGGPRCALMRLGPLDDAATAALIRTRLGDAADAAFCAACRAASGGNPLLLTELAHELADAGVTPTAAAAAEVERAVPAGIAPAVLRRVVRVDPCAAAVATALAILGDGAGTAHVAALAGVDPGAANAILEALARAELLARARPPAFAHPLVRAALAAAVAAPERGALHGRAARLLAADGAAPERLALHLAETAPGEDPWVVATLRDAAAPALARGAPETAARFLRRALREPPPAAERPLVLLAAGEAEAQAGDERAAAHLRAAIELADDGATRARAALALTPLLGMAGQVGAGVDVALAALDRLDGERELALRLEGELLSLARLDSEHRALGMERLARSDPAALGDSPGAGMVLAMHANEALSQGRSRALALAHAERALAGGRLLAMPFMYAQAATTVMFCGRYAQAVAAWDDFIAHARRRGDLPALALAHALRASAHWHAGALADALADAEVARHVAEARGLATAAAFARLFEVEARVLRGELDAARTALAAVPGVERQLLEAVLISARGRLRAAEGRWREALADMTAVGRLLDGWRTPNTALAPWRAEAALAAAALGDGASARRLAAAEVATAGRWGDPWLLGQALRAQALVGPAEQRVARLRAAVALLRPSEARIELARTLVELGGAECADGGRAEARETLREALALATVGDAPALAERARAALVAAGARPRRPASAGPAALTPSERRVARLAAAGAPNRAIAQTLFVTEKTVETHLAGAYRKLAIGGRAQLAGALGDD